jgi:hypothetical protein
VFEQSSAFAFLNVKALRINGLISAGATGCVGMAGRKGNDTRQKESNAFEGMIGHSILPG